MEGTINCSANYVPLTPISFLERAAIVYGDRPSVVYGDVKYTWKHTHQRCIKLASALAHLGISPGDGALEILSKTVSKLPLLVVIPECGELVSIVGKSLLASGNFEHESLLEMGKLDFDVRRPKDECDPISLNYTSGTSSSSKGVIYSHRGAYLNSLSTIIVNEMGSMPTYLWCVPMFHCNGWCLAWGMAAQGGANICRRSVTAKRIFDNIAQHKVTHFGGASTVLNMIVNAPARDQKSLPGKVAVITGCSPPPPPVLTLIHGYGLTETNGPGTFCIWKPERDSLPQDAQAKIKSRQGVQHLGLEKVDIKDPVTMASVPWDGKTMGEVMFRGNAVMNGYLKNLKVTEEAFSGGWFHSGDSGVRHPDGYIELKDRSKDIIISGGENISTIEVESVIFSHPSVLEAAVVGKPDEHCGKIPCAFVKLKDEYNNNASAEEIIKYCRERLPHFMAPRTVVFEDLPKTSTGKIQKYVLKQKAKTMGSISKKTTNKY
ncbi:Propionate-CoA ligase [Melia azedarach]|uniref:Propionate-CoA ligase n=1 Tax=Melia azedarach TaxID=155640 RepID=A0ACC1YLQ5_MELAZ|nr:Propionate-CoA ligase [Melia azedarach]